MESLSFKDRARWFFRFLKEKCSEDSKLNYDFWYQLFCLSVPRHAYWLVCCRAISKAERFSGDNVIYKPPGVSVTLYFILQIIFIYQYELMETVFRPVSVLLYL